MKLDIGCGLQVREGFVGVDIRQLPGVTYCCPAWEIERYVTQGSVVHIYSRHMLEHLTYHQVGITLVVWQRVLQVAGVLEVIVPNVVYHAEQLLTDPDAPSDFMPKITNRQHALAGFYGWQRAEHDYHLSGWSESSLTEALWAVGFRHIERQATDPWHLFLRAMKE